MMVLIETIKLVLPALANADKSVEQNKESGQLGARAWPIAETTA